MPSYHVDNDLNFVKDPPTNKDLSDIANAYQKKYFPGPSPELEIEITAHPEFGGTAAYAPTEKKIFIAKGLTAFEKCTRIALLHEMVHANLHVRGLDPDPKHEHGPEFKAEVKRLMAAGAYDDLL